MIVLVNLSICNNPISNNTEDKSILNEVNCFEMMNDNLQEIDSSIIIN